MSIVRKVGAGVLSRAKGTPHFQVSSLAEGLLPPVTKPATGPHSAVLNVTSDCNGRCYYCPVQFRYPLPMPSTRELLDAITQLRNLPVSTLTFSGGEPLTRDDIFELARHATANNLKVTVLTNGLMLTELATDKFVSAGTSCIVLSLDALRPDIYSKLRGVDIAKLTPALDVLEAASRSRRILVGLTCIVTMLNLDDLQELALYSERQGMSINYQPYHAIPGFERQDLLPTEKTLGELEASIDNLIELKKKGIPIANSERYLRSIPPFMAYRTMTIRHCHAGYTSISVDSDMSVRPCWSLPSVGSIREQSLKEIWDSRKYIEVRRTMRSLRCPGCLLLCHHEY